MSGEQAEIRLTAAASDAGLRMDVWLARTAGISRSRVQALLDMGMVQRLGQEDEGQLRPKDPVIPGQVYCIHLPAPVAAEPQPEAIRLQICYEDADIVVVDKPPGLVVHPAVGHPDGTLVNALLHHCQDLRGIGGTLRPGIVHRLDKDTSGVLVVAKHEAALAGLVSQFQSREVEKQYVAITVGVPDPPRGTIETQLGRSRHDRKRMSTNPVSGGKRAVSRYEVLDAAHGFALVAVQIETGRTHQIRVHLAHAGCPIAGDDVYGKGKARYWREKWPGLRQMLHAHRLTLTHPVLGTRLQFVAALPPDMRACLAAIPLTVPASLQDAGRP